MNQVKLKERILITIKRLGINGEGIGYYKRQAIFVENALPGEIVEVEIIEANNKYALGEITKVKKTSSDRVEPKCPYYGKCGGCQLQHLSYKAQLNEKRNLVIEAFNRYYDGDVSKIKFFDTIGMENPWNYRNKASLPVRHNGEKAVVGMYAKGSNMLIYTESCLVENRLVLDTIDEVLDLLTHSNVDIYNPKTRVGVLRYIVVRGFEETNTTQVTFVLTKEDKKTINILKKINATSCNYSINDDPKSIEIFGSKVINVKGDDAIEGKLGNLQYTISPMAFFQLNSKQTTVLYDKIKEVAKLEGKEKVLDCYCGIGSIGMMLADKAKEVRGIDTNKQGIIDANLFAKINGIDNAKFYAGNILPYLHQFKEEGFVPDVLVVDPPRKGLELNFINYLQKSNIKKIIYVSCNPSTLAKNINHLKKEYSINEVYSIDMFPQTANVEVIVVLNRK